MTTGSNTQTEAGRRSRRVVNRLPALPYVARVSDDGSRIDVDVGPQAADLLGYSLDDLSGNPLLWRDRLLHPDDRDRVLAAAARALASGEPTTSEYRLVARDGSCVWVSDVMVPLHTDPGAGERRLQGFIVDVTSRKELEQLQGAVLDTSLALIVVLDLEGRIRIASPSHETLLGRSPAELQGTVAAELVHPDDVARLRERRAALARGEPGALVTFRVRRADGDYIWVESSAQLAHDANGDPVVVGVSRDITADLRSKRERAAAEAHYRQLAEQLPLVPYVTRRAIGTGFEYIGPQVTALLGYSPEEFYATPTLWIDTLLHPGDRQRAVEHMREAWERGESTELEYRLVARDGRVVWVSDSNAPLSGLVGEDRLVQGFVVDVTTRREVEQLYRAVIETSPEIVAVLDADACVRFVSSACEPVLGYERDELLGAHVLDFVQPADLTAVRQRLGRIAAGLPDSPDVITVRHADGSDVPLEVRMQFANDANDLPIVLVVGRDVTDQRKSERDRSEAEARYRRLAEQLPLITYIDEPDEDTTPRYVSAAIERILGYRPEEWLADAQLWFRGIHPEDRVWVEPRVRDAYRRLDPHVELEYRFFRRDGKMVWLRDEAVLAVDDDGKPLYYQGFMLDLTERRELEERYLQAQRLEAVGRLAGGIAHDFNNILTAIGGYASFLTERLGRDSELGRDAAEIVSAAERAEQLTRQLLAFGRRQVLQPRPISLNGVVNGIQRLLARAAGEGIALVIDLADDDPWTFADSGQIEQVLLNLVVNARDAMSAGGTLRIATGRRELREGELANAAPGCYAVLSVSDTGVGMSEDVLANIFEPFFTTKDEAGGSGLGLSSVFGIVTQSGGYVDVDSAPSRGTTVRVLLPLERPAEREPDPVEPLHQPRSGRGERILLVEDEPRVRELATRMLERCGYAVIAAENGVQALAHPDLRRADLVVTDVVMPQMGGRELAERLGAERPGVPVLLVSGNAADQLELGGNLPRGTVFLAKPFTLQALASAVAALLEAARAGTPQLLARTSGR